LSTAFLMKIRAMRQAKFSDYYPIFESECFCKPEGLETSRLPQFTEDEKSLIYGSSDFFGLNHYTTNLAFTSYGPAGSSRSYYEDRESSSQPDATWPQAESTWLFEVPWGVRRLLKWIKTQYGDPEIIITENGFSESGESSELNDYWRKEFYVGYINEVLKARELDQVNVQGYTAWSLMDNFEWAEGYTERFGLHWIDFNDDQRPRVAKESVECYKEIMRRSFPGDVDDLEYCRFQVDADPVPGPPIPPAKPSKTDPIQEESYIDFLGNQLSLSTASTTLNALFGVSIALFCMFISSLIACCCRASRSKKCKSGSENLAMSNINL